MNEFRKPIPGFPDLTIDREGVVINHRSNRVIKHHIPKGNYNYPMVSLRIHKYKSVSRGVHRILMEVFYPLDNYEGMVVNHKNGIKTDFRFSNLEWVTFKENAEHAGELGLTSKCVPMSIKYFETDEVVHYPSAIECSRALGISRDSVLWRMRTEGKKLFPGKIQFRTQSLNKDRDWPDVSPHISIGNRRRIELYNMVDKHHLVLKTSLAAAKLLKVSPAALSIWARDPDQPVMPGFWIAKYEDDDVPWRDTGDPYLELSKTTGHKPVLVLNKDGEIHSKHINIAECGKHFKMPKTNIHYWMKRGDCSNRFELKFCYYYSI